LHCYGPLVDEARQRPQNQHPSFRPRDSGSCGICASGLAAHERTILVLIFLLLRNAKATPPHTNSPELLHQERKGHKVRAEDGFLGVLCDLRVKASGDRYHFVLPLLIRTHAVDVGGTGPPDRFALACVQQPVRRTGSTIWCAALQWRSAIQLHGSGLIEGTQSSLAEDPLYKERFMSGRGV